MATRKTPPKRWRELTDVPVPGCFDVMAYRFGALFAISSVDDGEFHVSCSKVPGTRPSDAEVRVVLADFDMVDAEEDNSHSRTTYTRHFWRPTVQA